MGSKKLYAAAATILLVLAGVILWFFGLNKDVSEDALKFKRDYEAYNEQSSYEKVAIEKNNKAVYVEIEDAIKLLNNGTDLLFIGSPKNHESRLLAETIVNLSANSLLDSFSYLDISNYEPTFKIKKDELVKVKEASEEYEKLKEILNKYTVKYKEEKDDKIYEAEELVIIKPLLIEVKNGKIINVISEDADEIKIEAIINDFIQDILVCDDNC